MNAARKLIHFLERWTQPTREELVLHLILHTAALELPPGEYMELAPVKGTCGPFRLYGNSLPVFEYTVFEKAIMEFIRVRVEISKPDRIQLICKIESTTAPERNGEVVETQPKYQAPFEELCKRLFLYFPFYKKKDL